MTAPKAISQTNSSSVLFLSHQINDKDHKVLFFFVFLYFLHFQIADYYHYKDITHGAATTSDQQVAAHSVRSLQVIVETPCRQIGLKRWLMHFPLGFVISHVKCPKGTT